MNAQPAMAIRGSSLRPAGIGLCLYACLTIVQAKPPGIPVDTRPFHQQSLPCLAVHTDGVDTLAEYREYRDTHETVVLHAGSWLGREGRYLLPPPDHPGTTITLRALDGGTLSPSQVSVSPCPAIMPAQAVDALSQALDERLRIHLGQPVTEPRAGRHFQTALRLLGQPGLEQWLAVAHYETGAYHRAATRLRAAENHYAAALALFDMLGDVQGSAAATNALGLVAWRRGLMDKARDRFLSALAMRNEAGATYAAASIANNLGLLHAQRGETVLALEYYEWALSRFQGPADLRRPLTPDEAAELAGHLQGEADLAAALNTLNNLALLLRDRDQVTRAERYWRNYLAMAPYITDTQAVARAQHNLGQLLLRQGRLDESLLLLADALQQFEHAGATRWIAETQVQLSQLYLRLGDTDNAFRHARHAAGMELEDIAVAADVWRHLGALQQQQGGYADAQMSLRLAGELAEQAESINRQLVIRTDLARLRFLQGEPDAAMQTLEQVYHEFNDLQQAGNAARVLSRIGEIHLHAGRTDQARRALETALAGHRARDDLFAELLTLELLSRVYQADSPARAIETDHQAIQLIETLRAAALPPLRRAELLALSRPVYDRQVLALLDIGQSDQAWRIAALARAGSVQELRHARTRGRDHPRRQALLAHHADLIEKLHQSTARTGDGSGKNPPPAATPLHLVRDIDRVQTELQGLDRLPLPVVMPAQPGQLQAGLEPDQLLLSYYLLPDQALLWIISPEATRVVRLQTDGRLDGRIDDLLAGARHPRQATGGMIRIARELTDSLLQPAAAEILTAGEILIQPDGVLHALPFALLPTPRFGSVDTHESVDTHVGSVDTQATSHATSTRPPLFVDTHNVTIVLGPGQTERDRGHVTSKPALLVLADPGWSADGGETGLLPTESLLGQLLRGQVPDTLPGTRQEALAIAELAAGHAEVRLKLGAGATREFMLSGEAGGYDTIHIATHGLVDLRYPMLSALVLTTGTGGTPAFLRPHDIAELDIRAGLVVLSGCDTGRGRIIAGEGAMSLARPFLVAGAGQVLASLWKVDDHRAALFMQRFYRHLLIESAPPATALAAAQRWIREQPETAHPYYWAGFVLTSSH